MESKEITTEKIEKLFEIYDKLTSLKEEQSKELSNAMINNNRKIKYNGHDIEERALWDEIKYTGKNGPAGKVLNEKYPKAFQKAEEYDRIVKEYIEYCLLEFEVNPLEITLANIIKLILGLIDYKLEKK